MQVPKRRGMEDNLREKDYSMSQKKYQELEAKLKSLESKRPQEAEEVKRLAEMGDFSENAGYQLAKSRLRGLNRGIDELKDLLKNAQIIITNSSKDIIKTGHLITLSCNGETKQYRILGESETNPSKGIISHLSPLGQVLINKRIGDSVTLGKEEREKKYKIINIEQ